MKKKAKLAGIIAIAVYIGFTLMSCDPLETVEDRMTPVCDTPFAYPPEGVYSEPQNVHLDCDSPGARIFYTTDGSTPTPKATRYPGGWIEISQTTTLKAMATSNTTKNSKVFTAVYTINSP